MLCLAYLTLRLQVSMMGSLEQVESCHTEGHTLMFGTQRSILGQVGKNTMKSMLTLGQGVKHLTLMPGC